MARTLPATSPPPARTAVAAGANASARAVRERRGARSRPSRSAQPAVASAATLEGCNAEEHADYWGDVVKWGQSNIQPNEAACCAECRSYRPLGLGKACNTWVFCGQAGGCSGSPRGSCWLKWQAKPSAPAASRGPEIGWTSGGLYAKPLYNGEPGAHRKFHVIVTGAPPCLCCGLHGRE